MSEIIHADECMCPKCKHEKELAVASIHINCNCPRCLEHNEKYPSWESRKDLADYRSGPRTKTELINKTLNVLLDIRDMLKTMDARLSDIRDVQVDNVAPKIPWLPVSPEPLPLPVPWVGTEDPYVITTSNTPKSSATLLAETQTLVARGKKILGE